MLKSQSIAFQILLTFRKFVLEEHLLNRFHEYYTVPFIINFTEYKYLNKDTKMALINESIKKIKKNYYDLRSKKVNNLISNLEKKDFKKSSLGGCIFFKKGENLCLKAEKL